MRGVARAVIEQLLEAGSEVSSTRLAQAAGISRQAAHKHLAALVRAGRLEVHGRARAARYRRRVGALLPRSTVLEVASAGSSFRLSARLLLAEAAVGPVTLDFNGVAEVGEEFLEEVFCVWGPAHPEVDFEVVNYPATFAPLLDQVLQRAPRPPGAAPQERMRLSAEPAARGAAAAPAHPAPG
jgi:DNA-binding transcriptional ArsR family regulator